MRLLLSACLIALSASGALADEWVLSWADEFDGPAVDTSKWRVEDAALVKNNEKQYYAPDEVTIEDGCLVLSSRKRERGGRAYTSGLVESKNRFSQLYGRFEFRTWAPRGKGVWPANWMLGVTIDSQGWPACGEIDVLELLGHDPATIYQTTHWGPPLRSSGTPFKGTDFTDTFHIYAVEWEPFEVRYYIDGILNHVDISPRFIPDIPHYILLNTAIGGDWPGDPDSTTVLPVRQVIDYVRVYKRPTPYAPLRRLATEAVNGTIRATPRRELFEVGTRVKLEAVPEFGYRFARWEGAPTRDSKATSIEVTMDTHRSVRAVFEDDPATPPLISRRAKVTASSLENDGTPPSNVADGDPKSRWASAWVDPQWIMVDLGAETAVTAIRLLWEAASAREFRIETSKNGVDWANVYETAEGKGGVTHVDGLESKARYVRVLGIKRNTPWGYSLYEVNVYGAR